MYEKRINENKLLGCQISIRRTTSPILFYPRKFSEDYFFLCKNIYYYILTNFPCFLDDFRWVRCKNNISAFWHYNFHL